MRVPLGERMKLREEIDAARRELSAHRTATEAEGAWTRERADAIYALAERLLAGLEQYERTSHFEGRTGELSRIYVARAIRGH